MRVCDGFSSETVKTENHAPPWGCRGGFSSKPSALKEKAPPKTHTGKVRYFAGNFPEGNQWQPLAENAGWWLLVDSVPGKGGWYRLKLGSKILRLGKANFVLAWNGERLAQGGEQKMLLETYPEMEEWVVAVLRGSHV